MGFNHQPAAAYIRNSDERCLSVWTFVCFVDKGSQVLNKPVPLLQPQDRTTHCNSLTKAQTKNELPLCGTQPCSSAMHCEVARGNSNNNNKKKWLTLPVKKIKGTPTYLVLCPADKHFLYVCGQHRNCGKTKTRNTATVPPHITEQLVVLASSGARKSHVESHRTMTVMPVMSQRAESARRRS